MMNLSNLSFFVAIGAVLMAGAQVCPAQTVLTANYGSINPSFLQLEENRTDWTDTNDVALFDPALGALTEVRLILFAEIGSEFDVTNTNSTARNFTFFNEGTLSVTAPGLPSLTVNAGSNVTTNVGVGASYSTGLITDTAQQTLSFTSAEDLAEWINTMGATRALTSTSFGNSYVTGPGNAASSTQIWARSTLTVEYRYAPVPEVSGALLMVLSGTMLLQRRRRSGLR